MEGTAKTRSHSLKSVLFQWETMIFVIFIIINIININLSSNYLNFNNMMNNMVVFMDKALMVFTTMMVLLLGEIDISIASIMCLSGCCTGVAFEAGLPIVPAMMVGLLVGAACGFFNGILLVAFPDLNSTIVTLGNQILFRGIAYMILEDKPITSISSKMSFLAWSKVAGIPLILIVFFVETLIFAFVIHRTKFGRSLYAIGSNAKASRFSGIKTNQSKVLVFTISGLCRAFPYLKAGKRQGQYCKRIRDGSHSNGNPGRSQHCRRKGKGSGRCSGSVFNRIPAVWTWNCKCFIADSHDYYWSAAGSSGCDS